MLGCGLHARSGSQLVRYRWVQARVCLADGLPRFEADAEPMRLCVGTLGEASVMWWSK